jgi:hypothetical protein
MGECRELQEMKNRGNELNEVTENNITLLSAANYARFAHELAQFRR